MSELRDDQTQSHDHLLSWVLSADASALYAELLVRGDTPFAEFAAAGRAVAAEELEAYGFVRIAVGKDRLVIPLPPEVPVVRNFATRTFEWLQAAPDSVMVAAGLRELSARSRGQMAFGDLRAGTRQLDLVRELPDRSDRDVTTSSMMTSARTELMTMQSSKVVYDPSAGPNIGGAPTDLLDRGVTMRFLYDAAILEDADMLRVALADVAAGAHARVVDELPGDFLVVDGSRALLTTSFDPINAMYTEGASFVAMLVDLFESVWSSARPVGHHSWDDATGDLTDGHRQVLSLVVNGLSNEAIARTLRVNPRTVRRRIDDLIDGYGVASRSGLITAAVRQADQ
jgi:DNA-binding NarL/FixJ family response regulator